jgi:putative ABC transport system permease protein
VNHASLVWANLRRRPLQGFLVFACAVLAFAIYGVMFGMLGSFRHASIQNPTFEQQLLTAAIVMSVVGMGLILLLTTAAMAHAVRLRINEFGLLQALGFSPRRIIALVVVEAAVPCVAGAVLGLLAVPLLFAVLAYLLPPLATLPPLAYSPTTLAIALAIALLVPSLGSVLPALRIVRIDAAAALSGSAEAAAPVRSGVADVHKRDAVTSSSKEGAWSFARLGFDPGLLRQVSIVTRIGFTTLHRRIRSALLITGGVACALFLPLWILCAARGISTGILESGEPSRALLHDASTTWLPYSHLPASVVAAAANAPGVERAADGSPLAEPVLYGTTGFPRRGGGRGAGIYIVGVGPHWLEMTPTFQLLSGRLPTLGTNEVLVGERVPRALTGLDGGVVKRALRVNSILTNDVEWRVVGTFTTGDVWDGYLVADIATLRRYAGDLFATAVLVKLTAPHSFDAFRSAVARQLPPTVAVERETDFYAGFWRSLPKPALYVAGLLGGLLALGIIAAMTQLTHAALEARRREIATLRVLGFDGRSVAVSIMLEAVLFAVLGASIATGAVWLLRDGDLWAGAWSVFEYKVDLPLLLLATGSAAGAAVIGTLPMALRTLRKREMEALQALREVEETNVAAPSHRRRGIDHAQPAGLLSYG